MTLIQLFETATAGEISSGKISSGKVSTITKASATQAALFPIIFDPKKKTSWKDRVEKLPAPWNALALKRIDALKFKPKKRDVLSFEGENLHNIVLAFWSGGSAFETLGWARTVFQALKGSKAKAITLDATHLKNGIVLDALVSAFTVSCYRGPKYGKKSKAPKPKTLVVLGKNHEINGSFESARATNVVRYLTEMAGNDLTPTLLRDLSLSLAKLPGVKATFLSKKELEKKNAGAFLAVVRGTDDPGVGIVKITYRPKKGTPKKRVALVGKGVTFDTGGNNLKTGGHMLGMHGDMGGSALVLALLLLAHQCQWDFVVEGFVTVAENVLGPTSYRPNDVVTASNGKTIEVIDTDAEGRMLLADALSLASSNKPDLIVDFATLTGACVRAIGTAYSGAFTNKRRHFAKIRRAGVESGERVWPFPNDPDYGDCLKSEIADIKQCRASGGSDHIEASYFLSQFVGKVPWVHIDLSSCENEGGLAHVPSKVNGFGVRFTQSLLEK